MNTAEPAGYAGQGFTAAQVELLQLNQQLLDAIDSGDWDTYARLCDPGLTAYEPEAAGHLVPGLGFHRTYFEAERSGMARSVLSSPHVRLMGDSAVLCGIRLIQRRNSAGGQSTSACSETRVWQRSPEGEWRHVHFHRSPAGFVELTAAVASSGGNDS